MTPSRALATLGGIGYAPIAPGTWASAATVFVFWGVAPSLPTALALLGALAAAAWWSTAEHLTLSHETDPSEIVIDEALGQWVALLPLAGSPLWLLALAFSAFRFFDIVKPGPVSWAERLPGPLGVLADDVVAGVAALIVALGASLCCM